MFQCRSARERFAHVHHVKCDLDQNSSTAVRHHMTVNDFLFVVLQCHVVRCHSFDVCRTHHAVQTRVGRRVQNIQNRSSTRVPQFDWKTDLPNSPCTDVSCCLPANISRVSHLRIQSCSLEIILDCCADVFELGFQSSTCLLLSLSLISVTLDFDFPVPLPLPWDLFVCLYQQSAALCPYFPQFRLSPSNRECSVVVSP